MKHTMKIGIIIVLSIILSIGLIACSKTIGSTEATTNNEQLKAEALMSSQEESAETTVSQEEDAESNATTEDAENTSSEVSEDENADATTETSDETSGTAIVPDGFTERDFDIGYSEYETITLLKDTANTTADGVKVEDGTIRITSAGEYLLTGEYEGQIVIDVPGTEDKVQLILDNATITNDSSAAIYVLNADKVFFTTTSGSTNKVSTTGTFVQVDENEVDGAIFSKGDIVFNGAGTLIVTCSEGHGIVSKDDLKITSGTYEITAASKGLSANDLLGVAGGSISIDAGDDGMNTELEAHILDGEITMDVVEDGIHADALLTVDGGTISIDAAEGLEATVVTINDGDISINSYDDAINASQKVQDYTATLEINGGNITINMSAGDTDALDSNGYLYINGGTVNINAQFPFDYDLGGEITGGEVYVNGEAVSELYNSMMGGGGFGAGGPGGGFGGPGFGRP